MNKAAPNLTSLKTIPIFFCTDMLSDPSSFSPSAGKPKLALESWVQLGMAMDVRVPAPVMITDLERAHNSEFVRNVLSLDTPNGFGTYDEQVARSLPWTSGAMLCAAREAMGNGRVAVAPVSGFHHAGHSHAGGYCTFNGLMVTAMALLAEGGAKKVGILDFDQHWGDGTQDIIATLGLQSVIEHYSPVREFSEKSRADAFLRAIPAIVAKFQACDVILYQAGADPHVDDPLGGWLTTEQLFERDRLVFESAAALGLPIAWNLAGGYQTPMRRVLDIHDNTMRACCQTFLEQSIKPERTTILSLAAEGGGLTILGVKKCGEWIFQAVTDDHTPTLIDEDAIHKEHGWMKSLAEALSQIEYPWNSFYPCEMHPEFAAEILKLKRKRDAAEHFYEQVTHEWEQCVKNALNPQNPQNSSTKKSAQIESNLDGECDSTASMNPIRTTMVKLKKGTRVRHISQTDWGVGQLLEDSNSEFIRIFFEGKGESVMLPAMADKLRVVSGTDAESTLLDHMYLPGLGKSRPMLTMAQAKTRLLEMFPGGLHGDKMRVHERDYKDELAALARQLYAPERLQALLLEGKYVDILVLASQLVKVVKNNFPATFEKIAFNNAVKVHARPKEFAEAFCGWVLPDQPSQETFEAFAKELDHMNCAKWPILTSYRYLLHSQVDALIKPTNLAKAAEIARFEINYRSDLNWLTYHTVMEFYRCIRQEIADLNPRDMIDVQNFIWCIDPEQYPQ